MEQHFNDRPFILTTAVDAICKCNKIILFCLCKLIISCLLSECRQIVVIFWLVIKLIFVKQISFLPDQILLLNLSAIKINFFDNNKLKFHNITFKMSQKKKDMLLIRDRVFYLYDNDRDFDNDDL